MDEIKNKIASSVDEMIKKINSTEEKMKNKSNKRSFNLIKKSFDLEKNIYYNYKEDISSGKIDKIPQYFTSSYLIFEKLENDNLIDSDDENIIRDIVTQLENNLKVEITNPNYFFN